MKRQKSYDGGSDFWKVVVLMCVSAKIQRERSRLLSTYETMHLMIEFGSFLLSLIGLMIVIVKVSNKK